MTIKTYKTGRPASLYRNTAREAWVADYSGACRTGDRVEISFTLEDETDTSHAVTMTVDETKALIKKLEGHLDWVVRTS